MIIILNLLFDKQIRELFEKAKIKVFLHIVIATGLLGVLLYDTIEFINAPDLIVRNFYGILQVKNQEWADSPAERVLLHGSTLHGTQLLSEEGKYFATSYYGEGSGVQKAYDSFPDEQELHVGVIGLGTGTMAAHGDENDRFQFYEIDEDIKQIAENKFTYLSQLPGEYDIHIGDARITLTEQADQEFDLLVIDAFSSDAIPVHLLTKEAFELYRRHIKEEGWIAVHISNRHLDLGPVVSAITNTLGLEARLIEADDGPSYVSSSNWVIVGESAFPEGIEINEQVRLWTDDYSNLLSVLHF
jgi:hypothetical protein